LAIDLYLLIVFSAATEEHYSVPVFSKIDPISLAGWNLQLVNASPDWPTASKISFRDAV
jgi:hypothetical protein